MKQNVCVNRPMNRVQWYDNECKYARQNVRKLLRIFRKSLDGEDSDKFCTARREYKRLLRSKKKMFNDALFKRISDSVNDQQEFWKAFRSVSKKKSQYSSHISMEQWYLHFKGILEKEVKIEIKEVASDDYYIDDLDRPISKDEVLFAIRKLKNKKAPGPDGLIGEFYKHLNYIAVDCLVKLFNSLFDKGIYPRNWTESLILPLFKKGDVNNTDNYRGISLSDVVSKLYSSIINRRLSEWIKTNNVTGEYQAGFKKNYSTIDHIFTLMAAIEKQFANNRKLYVAFIDFEKAFDSINRNLLWPILIKNGVTGKLLKCIKSMYNVVKARIMHGNKLTDVINCTAGVKQGNVCSPVLFSLFINELAVDVIRNGRHGAHFALDPYELFILLLADDVVLFSETVIGLQTQLNSLFRAAANLNLTVNINKSNIIVFRKGGYLAAREKWLYGRITMPVVNIYKYLGIYFSTKLSFTGACSDLASRGKNALLCIMHKLYFLNNNSLEIFLKIFDSKIQPIMLYGAELWGLDKAANLCEKVHLFGLKRFLDVDRRTPNDFVYGETNRYPITINSTIKCIRYWFKLLAMNADRLPHKAYTTLYNLDERGKKNWVSNIKLCLFEYGFGHVWINQGVGSIPMFINAFRLRLVDCTWQNWEHHIRSSERFKTYSLFNCVNFSVKSYLTLNLSRAVRQITAKFRFGVSDICLHRFRYNKQDGNNLLCPLCKKDKEDELHFVLVCPALQSLRERYIPAKFYRDPCLFRLFILMSSDNESLVKRLSLYLYKAFKLRSTLCS